MLDFRPRDGDRETAFPDMTPMIDCVFQLLIFFLLASSFAAPAIVLNLPSAAADGTARDRPLVISVAADRQVAVNGQLVALDQLDQVLRRAALDDSTAAKGATLRADKGLDYEFVLGIIAKLHGAGIETVDLSHERR